MAEIAYKPQALNITPRQRAFQQGLNTLMDAGQQGIKAYQDNQKADRDRAFQALQFQQQLANQGMEVTPEIQAQISQGLENDPSSLGSILSQAAEGKRDRATSLQEEERGRKASLRDQLRQQDLDDEQSRRAFEMDKVNKVYGYNLSRDKLKQQQSLTKAEDKLKLADTPQKRLSKLGEGGKSKVGSIASGLSALNKMARATGGGDDADYIDANTPFIGGLMADTPFSENQAILSEVVGRLQSGGAIQSDELKTFRAMGPRAGDDAVTQQRKLVNQTEFLKNKLAAYGLSEDDLPELGFEIAAKYDPNKEIKLSSIGQGNQGQAVAQAPMAINPIDHPEKNRALAWAQANPDHPSAQAVISRFGALPETVPNGRR